jgi:hypothetical protein
MPAPPVASSGQPPRWWLWTVGCGLAEVVGMAAAAACAAIAVNAVGEPHDLGSASVTVVGAVLGGVVEGAAVGTVQWGLLRPWLPGLGVSFVFATIAAAAAAWFLGMAPATGLQWAADGSTATDSVGPPLWLMPLAGLLAGAVLGALFGAVQALVLRRHVGRAHRWVWANLLGWAVGMAVIMTGAAVPSASWPTTHLLLLAALTGVIAGLGVGAVTGLFLFAIDDDAPLPARLSGRVVCRVLRSPAHALLSGALLELRYTGTRTGACHVLPVQYASHDSRLVVLPAHSATKTWWRNLRTPTPVSVVLNGAERAATAKVLWAPAADWTAAAYFYEARFPRMSISVTDPLVQIVLSDLTPEDQPQQVAAEPH